MNDIMLSSPKGKKISTTEQIRYYNSKNAVIVTPAFRNIKVADKTKF